MNQQELERIIAQMSAKVDALTGKWGIFSVKVFTEGKKVVGNAFFLKERFLVKIMGLCPMSPQARKGLTCNLVVYKKCFTSLPHHILIGTR